MNGDWLEEYRECSEDRRHYTDLTWQIPSAVLVVDSVVVGLAFSKDADLPSGGAGALVLLGGIFSLILTFNFWKYVYRSSRRLERLKEIEKQHPELRRFTDKEPWYARTPLGQLTAVFLFVVSLSLLYLGACLLQVWPPRC